MFVKKYTGHAKILHMQINKSEKILIYTNVFFLIPIIIGIKNQEWSVSMFLCIFVLSSTLYHMFRKPGAEWWWHTEGRNSAQTLMLVIEIVLALILSTWSIVLLYQKSLSLLITAIVIFIPSFIMFLSTNYRRYPLYHSIWHIASAVIITLALL